MSNRLSVLLVLGASAALGACHDWTQYDPRLGSSSSSSGGAGGSSGAGGAPAVCSVQLTDMFTALPLGDKWKAPPTQTLGGTVTIAGEKLVLNLPDTTKGAGAEIVSAMPYDITACRAFVRLDKAPDLSIKSLAIFQLQADDKNVLILLATEEKLQAKRKRPNPDPSGMPIEEQVPMSKFEPYDPMLPVYLGIRELNGTVIWESSLDTKTWTTIATAKVMLPSPMVTLKIGAFTYQTEASPPGEIHFDDLNVGQP
jgi:hypothetical protein